MGPFLKQLCELTGYEMAVPMNSGAEAVETAIKAARMWGYRAKGVPHDQAEIIVCDGNFAGRTIALISFSSEEQYKSDFGPLTPGFKSIPYGDADALAAAITPNTVAFLAEPIQGEGGVNVPPAGYLKRVSEICTANNILFMADEIQTGLGRTGALLCSDHEGVRPDVVTLGKALSGGFYPVSAVLADRRCSVSSAPATTAAPSAAIRWPRPSAAPRWTCWSTKGWWSIRAKSAPTSRAVWSAWRATTSWKCAARGCSSASS